MRRPPFGYETMKARRGNVPLGQRAIITPEANRSDRAYDVLAVGQAHAVQIVAHVKCVPEIINGLDDAHESS